jgi:4-hydroxybenzoate polyprenyltransferase
VTTLLGLITVFAGYTAVYALNDLVDYRADREKIRAGEYAGGEEYLDLDSLLMRHPLARGVLTLPEGILWAGGWALVAMIGAWLLNPVCFYIFLAGGLLEAVYCLLWRVTPLRALINGIVKSLGAVAAVYAVNPQPLDHFCDGPVRLDLLPGRSAGRTSPTTGPTSKRIAVSRPGPSPFNWAWRGLACWP